MKRNDLKHIVLSSLRQHMFRTVITGISIVLSIVLEVLPPLVLASAVDHLTDDHVVSAGLAAGYFALLACSGLADAVKEGLIVKTGEGITHTLRTAMMDKLHRLPAGYFTEHEAGRIASLHVNDVDAIEDMFSSGIVSMFSDVGTVIGVLVIVFTKSRGLGVILLIMLPLLFAFTLHVQKKMLAAHTENRQATARASGVIPETMHIIRSLHVYMSERFAEWRYSNAVSDSFRAMEKTNYYDAIYSPVILTASAVVIAVMMSLSGQSGDFRAAFGMSVGTAVAMISYVNNIFTPLSSIGMEIQTVQSAAAGWKRVQDYMNEEEMPEQHHKVPELTAEPNDIEVQNVSFSYNGIDTVLENFSMNVGRGEFVTITGRTGAGKSTLFKLLLGLYEPSDGEIRIAGIRPSEFSSEDRRRTVCCVEQRLNAVPGTVRDQVTLGDPMFTDEEVWKALETAGLAETVRGLDDGLDTEYDDRIFSQGQKQLLMIARAVVSDPRILLLDEITAGLDSATEKIVTDSLRRASEDRTVLSISHRLTGLREGRIIRI